jgi:hypothetical protein
MTGWGPRLSGCETDRTPILVACNSSQAIAVADFSALLTSFAMMLVSAEIPWVDTPITELVGARSLIIGSPFVVAYAISETSTRH